MTRIDVITATMVIALMQDCGAEQTMSLYPLFGPADRQLDDALVGQWTSGGQGDQRLVWTFLQKDSSSYILVLGSEDVGEALRDSQVRALVVNDSVRVDLWSTITLASMLRTVLEGATPDSSGRRGMFEVLIGDLGQQRFVDIAPSLNPTVYSEALDHIQFVPIHWFWRLSKDSPYLRLWPLSDGAVDGLLEDSAALLSHTRPFHDDSSIVVLTAETVDLQAFIAARSGDDRMFDDPLWLQRWPVWGDSTAGSGTIPGAGVTQVIAARWGCRVDRVLTAARTVTSQLEASRLRSPGIPAMDQDFWLQRTDRSACGALAAFGVPAIIDSAGTGDGATLEWWYHDVASDQTETIHFRRESGAWRAHCGSGCKWDPQAK